MNWVRGGGEEGNEVNLCMQHNEANAIIYKPVGDTDFARYSFRIPSQLYTHFSITTTLKNQFSHFEGESKKYHLKIAARLYLSLTLSKFISEEEGTSISWTAGELDFEYRDCHTEGIKVSPFEHLKKFFLLWV